MNLKNQYSIADFAVVLTNVTTVYPNGFVANDHINFNLKYGEIHCLLGENGAGKSTLVKTLFGEEEKSSGKIYVNGKEIFKHNPIQASFCKMGIIHQHFSLIKNFTVFENLILGYEIRKPEEIAKIDAQFEVWQKKITKEYEAKINKINDKPKKLKLEKKLKKSIQAKKLKINEQKRAFWIPRNFLKTKILAANKKFKLNLDINQKVSELTMAQRQKVEILKLLIRDAKIVIFDEPTSVLDSGEIADFLKLMRNYRIEGKAIIFVTHKIEEIIAVGDRVTVLRDGKSLGTFDVAKTTKNTLVELLAGEKNTQAKKKYDRLPVKKDVLLDVRNLSFQAKNQNWVLKNVNFKIHKREIVGLAGIENNGQRQLFEIITGIINKFEGDILFDSPVVFFRNRPGIDPQTLSKKWQNFSLNEKKKLGIAYVPQDRISVALLPNENLFNNFVFNNLEHPNYFSSGFFRSFKKQNAIDLTQNLINEYKIKGANSPWNLASSLSGGNQQKFIIAREMSTKPSLFIADQPTWGVDVLSIDFIHRNFLKHRNQDHSLLFASSNIQEIISLADRILVISRGQIVGEVNPKINNCRQKILDLMVAAP